MIIHRIYQLAGWHDQDMFGLVAIVLVLVLVWLLTLSVAAYRAR